MTAFLFILLSRNLEEKKTSFDLVVLVVENLLPNREDIRGTGSILGQEDLLEKEMATHSSILTWEVPWTKEAGGLQSMGSQKSETRLKDQTTAS